MATTDTLTLTIAKVDQILFEGEALSVYVPGIEGVMTVLPHHEPFVSILAAGDIVVTEVDNTERTLSVADGGVIEISTNQATILV
ncbi:F0F1 ATP synthase subunit epsilon [Candidatus Kaiserbacteria bacterium]|nr:F0F1 ATP synthase subunit epsilon [Candidatus Kaiserbacteria bacterium]